MPDSVTPGCTDAADFGFHPGADGPANTRALQSAVDRGGTVRVTQPGTYDVAGTVYLGSHTAVEFGHGVFVRKVAAPEPFTHVFLNRGALTRTCDHGIAVRGLQLIVNGVDVRRFEVYGLHGQVAFFYAHDIRIERFRCLDLGASQYAIQVCTFEDLIIDDVIIKGDKDGVHLGRGRRFTIRNGVFQTFDDAIALNAHDYATGNPELGWIEQGVVENCHDLDAERTTGFFCRILAGAWREWTPGMTVQQSDAVVAQGRVYRVQAQPDGTVYTSHTRPAHHEGQVVLDGIPWGVVQADAVTTAGVRNVTFRDIFLAKPRIGFSVHFDCDRFSRSYYPGATAPVQEQLVFANIRVLHDQPRPLISINTPVNALTVDRAFVGPQPIEFRSNGAMTDYGPTHISLHGCVFRHAAPMPVLVNRVPGKSIHLQTAGSIVLQPAFSAAIENSGGHISHASDLPGLQA